MRRKLFMIAAALMTGIVMAETKAWIAMTALVTAFLFAGITTSKTKDEKRFVIIMILSFIFGVMSYEISEIDRLESSGLDSEASVKVKIKVMDVSENSKGNTTLDAVIIHHPKIKRKGDSIRISHYGNVDATKVIARTLETRIAIREPESAGNPRCFDYRAYLRSKGIYHVADMKSFRFLDSRGSISDPIRRMVVRARIRMGDHFKDEHVSSLMKGVIFGYTKDMDEDLKDDFRDNGLAHILAVSGLHIGALYSLYRSLKKRYDSRITDVVFLISIVMLGTFAMWSVSVTRAVIMILVLEAGDRLERRYDLISALSLVSLITLILHPFTLFSDSFILSYLAVFSMGTIGNYLERKGAPASLLSVNAGLLPYLAYSFNHVPLLAPVFNIPVIFLMSYLVPSGLVVTSLDLLPEAAVTVFFRKIILMISFLISKAILLINKAAGIPGFLSPDVVSPPLFLVFLIYSLMFIMTSETWFIMRSRKRLSDKAAFILPFAVLFAFSLSLSANSFDKADIVMIDVGQGDAMHFRYDVNGAFPGGKTDVLIDGGGKEDQNIGKKVLKPYFLKNGHGSVELAYATHLHTDHYKGLVELEKEGLVDRLVTTGKTGDTIWFGKKKDRDNCIEIIYPDEQDPDTDDENKNSLIFKVHIEGITCLVTGDLGEEGERALIEKYKGTDVLDCDILKVCHHGSRYSSSNEFLQAVSPKIALIGVGKRNTYGHPAEEVLERLKEVGARVYRTDMDGAIGIEIGKGGIMGVW